MLSFLMAMLRRIKYNLSRNGINTSAVCKRIFFIQRKAEQSLLCSDVVRVAGLEPVQSCLHKNLNLARLPIPPYPHILLTKLLYRILRKNQAQTEKNPERVSLRVISLEQIPYAFFCSASASSSASAS